MCNKCRFQATLEAGVWKCSSPRISDLAAVSHSWNVPGESVAKITHNTQRLWFSVMHTTKQKVLFENLSVKLENPSVKLENSFMLLNPLLKSTKHKLTGSQEKYKIIEWLDRTSISLQHISLGPTFPIFIWKCVAWRPCLRLPLAQKS